jgi:23S rRNA (guanine2445-N2)-methyltransferase / 23S rRNA (guanine2069-N7)-methyltransferase
MFVKVRKQQKGVAQYEKLAAKKVFHTVRENDCNFLVNFEDYLDTGLFLDHRLTRKMLADLSRGKSFLNLFGYTGTASVYAAKGGATSTTTVDMSTTYLNWAEKNMTINGFTNDAHSFVRANCLEWLDNTVWNNKYGLIFLDPPSFSSSKRMEGTFDVQRDHVALIKKTVTFLEPDGILIFSNNFRKFKMDTESLPGLEIENITKTTIPKDFERNPKIHNCWKIRLSK